LNLDPAGNVSVLRLVTKAIPHAIRNWAPQHFDLFQAVTMKFYMNRNPHSVESLARIRCPVAIIHCSEDIAYPIHHAEELLNMMLCAGINARLVSIEDAPHCGNITHFEE
jgi:pimeloyl-ACP methyl ester carboxylesterase